MAEQAPPLAPPVGDVPIVFLDIDGVALPFENQSTARACGDRISQLCRETGAKVVISSSWRWEVLDEIGAENWRIAHTHPRWIGIANFLRSSVNLDVPVIGFTPDHSNKEPDEDGRVFQPRGYRGEEILAWLAEHPEITQWVVLDDLEDWIGDKIGPNLVLTNGDVGFDEHALEKAIALLG